MHRRLVLLGPPAAGKGTQAELLKERFGFQIPSVGAMLRDQRAAGTPVGLRAAEYFERGLLVPDEVSIEVVRCWIETDDTGPWALDGFPRTVVQAEAFDSMLARLDSAVDLALLLEIDEPVIRQRIANRLLCPGCGAVYSIGLHVPTASHPCPRCGAALSRRADDNPAAISGRLAEYRNKTVPVIAYYQSRGILERLNADQPVQSVFEAISSVVAGAREQAAP